MLHPNLFTTFTASAAATHKIFYRFSFSREKIQSHKFRESFKDELQQRSLYSATTYVQKFEKMFFSIFSMNFESISRAEVFLALSLKIVAHHYRRKTDVVTGSVTRKKSPNVHKSCPKIISLNKWKILTALQKLPKNVGDLCKVQ